MIIIIFTFCTGMIAGFYVFIRGVYLSRKSSYDDIDAAVWCIAGAVIIQITTIIAAFLLSHLNS